MYTWWWWCWVLTFCYLHYDHLSPICTHAGNTSGCQTWAFFLQPPKRTSLMNLSFRTLSDGVRTGGEGRECTGQYTDPCDKMWNIDGSWNVIWFFLGKIAVNFHPILLTLLSQWELCLSKEMQWTPANCFHQWRKHSHLLLYLHCSFPAQRSLSQWMHSSSV